VLPTAAFIVFFFSLAMLPAQSGQTYEGPPVAGEKMAMVILSDIQILSINGIARFFGNFGDCTVEFLPGKYNLLLRQRSSNSVSKPMTFSFSPEAGRDYALAGDYEIRGGFFDKGVYFTPYVADITSEIYTPGSSPMKEKKYHKFRGLVAKGRETRLGKYQKFLDKLGSFEPIKLTFFEYDGTTIPDDIKPGEAFDLASSRYILAQLKVRNLKPDLQEHRHTLKWEYYFPQQWTADKNMVKYFHVGTVSSEMLFKQGQEYSFPWVAWGNKQKGWIWTQGNPVKGTYAVEVYLDKIKIFEDRFVIY